ncbi:ubiquinone biosynthesis protein COQ4, mitochondrial [Peziza echinospora]|nr:ubiquinone biosynthesis protein COQ4, mitochondrial [Peziza echinospora]
MNAGRSPLRALRCLRHQNVLRQSQRTFFTPPQTPPPNYPGHIPTTAPQKALLAFGSALGSFLNPRRGDLIAILGETTCSPYFIQRLHSAMLTHPTGRRLLREKPRITSTSLSIPTLLNLPANTVGHAYATWLHHEHVSPDTRPHVQYIDDPEHAYVMQRYRESHDFYHALTGLPVIREGEVALKMFEWCNTLLPMTGLATVAVTTLPKEGRKRMWEVYFPWAIRNGLRCEEVINVYWEEELETDVDVLRKRLGLEKPPE